MSVLRKELTFEGGVSLDKDPHLLAANEWLSLENMWPYSDKLLGSRPSLLHEQDILPVPPDSWNGNLDENPGGVNPTNVKYYPQWFRHLTPLKALFMGALDKVALICVCNQDNAVTINEEFEEVNNGLITLVAGDVILLILPCDITSNPTPNAPPICHAVRLGKSGNITPSLIEFNGEIIAANKGCDYVVRVRQKSSFILPEIATEKLWPSIDYRYTKINFGPTNLDFKPDSVIVYKNRFVYAKHNKIWFSDAFQPGVIYENAFESAYLGVFFDTGLTEEIIAMTDLYTSSLDEAGKSVLAIWTQHSMLMIQGEPATTIASTAEEFWAPCSVTRFPLKCGCVSQASIVKTKDGIVWCGSESVWFMAKGNLPIEVGVKISPRIMAQSFESAGRIFATYDDNTYRLVINTPGVGYNPYEALNEMWCLTFANGKPTAESAAWFGPQVFTNTDNPKVGALPEFGGPPGLFCCAKLTNINDDKTWYIQPYTCPLGITPLPGEIDGWGTRLGLASLSHYLGVDVTAPYRPALAQDPTVTYDVGSIYQKSLGKAGEEIPYVTEYTMTDDGEVPVYLRDADVLWAKRPMYTVMDATEYLPNVHTIKLQSANMVFENPELKKLICGYELTYKTLNPVSIKSHWWPWEPMGDATNIVLLDSRPNLPVTAQNIVGGAFNEPVLTARRVPPPPTKRYNGLTAQLNIMEDDSRVIVAESTHANPNWNKIRIRTDLSIWYEFDLFDYNTEGIAKYDNLIVLLASLAAKVLTATGKTLLINLLNPAGLGLAFDDVTELTIDLTAQGWEWFGFVPTGVDTGYGVNVISNTDLPADYIYGTGPVPFCTPHSIHLAKLAVRYRLLTARPR